MNPFLKISDKELEFRLKDLVSKERKLLHVILEHIKEVDNRKIYLQRAYSSLFEYLIKELGYSNSAAMRRIEAARFLKEVPVLAHKIKDGSINLTQIGELSRAIKEKQKTSALVITSQEKAILVESIAGKTTSETQKELAQTLDIQVQEYEIKRTQQDESVRLEITLTKDQFQKLMNCKDLAAAIVHQNSTDSSIASLIEVLADQYLTKPSPKAIAAPAASRCKDSSKVNKTLTPKTRRFILARDNSCQFKDSKTGKKCESTYGLHIDHKTSQWTGGSHSQENLQVLCSRHNQFKYKQEARISGR